MGLGACDTLPYPIAQSGLPYWGALLHENRKIQLEVFADSFLLLSCCHGSFVQRHLPIYHFLYCSITKINFIPRKQRIIPQSTNYFPMKCRCQIIFTLSMTPENTQISIKASMAYRFSAILYGSLLIHMFYPNSILLKQNLNHGLPYQNNRAFFPA